MKWNIPMVGFIIGAIMPLIGLTLMYLIMFNEYTFSYYLDILYGNHKVASKVLTLGLLLNLVPFLLFTRRRYDYAARGILIATILYALFIIMVKYIW